METNVEVYYFAQSPGLGEGGAALQLCPCSTFLGSVKLTFNLAGNPIVLFYVLGGSTRYFVSSTSTSPKRDLLVTADIGLNMENIVAAVEGALLLSSR